MRHPIREGRKYPVAEAAPTNPHELLTPDLLLLGSKPEGLPNTHYYGRAADFRWVDGKPVRGNGADRNILDVGRVLANIPPQQRPDQIIGPPSWTKALGRSSREGWILDDDQLELHEDHLHIGYLSEGSTSNTR